MNDRAPAPTLRPRPLGQALRRSEVDLDRLSQITYGDILGARSLWYDHAPVRFKRLIDTTVPAPGSEP